MQLTVYKRTITRYIADDKVVCQGVRQVTWLALDNSWARRRLKHLSWRSWWIILCTLEWRMPASRKISLSDRCILACPPDWPWGPAPSQCSRRYTPNRVCCSLVVGQLYPSYGFSSADYGCFQLPSFQPFLRNSLNSLRAPYPFDSIIFDHNHIIEWNFHDFI